MHCNHLVALYANYCKARQIDLYIVYCTTGKIACIKFIIHKKNVSFRMSQYHNIMRHKSTNQIMIQVLDDEFDIVNIIKLYLKQAGIRNVLGFTDPLLALEHFRINCKDYSLVISDIRMPGMNGFEFVRKVREINPAINVLLMSAFEINSTELSVGLGGINIQGFIQKPVSLLELGSIVQKQLKIKIL